MQDERRVESEELVRLQEAREDSREATVAKLQRDAQTTREATLDTKAKVLAYSEYKVSI